MSPPEEQPSAGSAAPTTLPERPAEGSDGAVPSKNALKKAAKEKEKAEKAARRKAEEEKQKASAAASDTSADCYGKLPLNQSTERTSTTFRSLSGLSTADENTEIVFTASVDNARVQSAKLAFLMLSQWTSTIQAVVAADAGGKVSRQMVKWAGGINQESKVKVYGLVKKPLEPVKSATVQNLEVHIQKIYIIVEAESQLPIQPEDASRPLPLEGETEALVDAEGRPVVSLSKQLDFRTISLRVPVNKAIFRIKAGVLKLFREYLDEHGFMETQTPKIMGSATEGGANVFKIKYFQRDAFLSQSPQFAKQMLIASGYEKVYEVGPVFRAENSNTARHLTEFTGMDLEMQFNEHYHEAMEVIMELLLYIFNGLQTRYAEETEIVRQNQQNRIAPFKIPTDGKILRLTFAEGIKMLREDGVDVSEYEDLSTPDEKRLGRLVLEKYNTDVYVLDKFPLAVRPFYTMPDPENPKLSNSYDFFMRGQEILSGAQRVHDYDFLRERMKGLGLDPDSDGMKSYVSSFKYGCMPHAGGGIGLERIVMLWLGLPNIRLACLFPRDPQRLEP